MSALADHAHAVYRELQKNKQLVFSLFSLLCALTLCAVLYISLPEAAPSSEFSWDSAEEERQRAARWLRIQQMPILTDEKIMYILNKLGVYAGLPPLLIEPLAPEERSANLRVRPFRITTQPLHDAPIFDFLKHMCATLPCTHLADVQITRETTLTPDILLDLSRKKDVSLLRLSILVEWIEAL